MDNERPPHSHGPRRHGPAALPGSPWRELKEKVRIPQLLAAAGRLSGFRRRGSRWVGPCPIHDGDNPLAFTVNVERNLWYCFSRCARGGTVLDLALALCDGSWSRAFRWLSQLALVPTVPEGEATAPAIRHESSTPAFRPFRPALDLDPAHPFFRRPGLHPDTVRRFEAGAWHGRGYLAGMVAVRLHDLAGRPIGYAGRRLDPSDALRWGKWKWPPRFPKSQWLYNWHRVQSHLQRGLIVVEGAWSVMKLYQVGWPGAVALGGVQASPAQRSLLARARRVILFLDGDDTGRAATTRLTRDPLHPHLIPVTCPSGHDPADLPEDILRQLLATTL